MEPSFWHERWRTGVIPFHQGKVNQMLERWFETLELDAGIEIFVPLCGKAYDMRWLLDQQFRVLGVELSDIAAGDFFTENKLPLTRRQGERYGIFEGPNIRILCGDIFDLDSPDMATVGGVYDRASLVALPETSRGRYADHLITHLPAGVPMLLVSFEYDARRMNGPPFSVAEAEVRSLYESRYTVRQLESMEVIDKMPIFRERGLDSMIEHAFLCTDNR